DASRLRSTFKAAEAWLQSLRSEAQAASALTRLIERVELKPECLQVAINLPMPSGEGREAATPNQLALARFVPIRMKRRGVEMRPTGRGADMIIIDDPLKPDEALSEVQRNAVNDWYDHTLYSRQNSKQDCVII